jgi:hypothetical protein
MSQEPESRSGFDVVKRTFIFALNLRCRSVNLAGFVTVEVVMRRALLVDPNVARLDLLKKEINQAVAVTPCTDFVDARTYLLTEAPDFLITHVRLGAYNGLHLVHLLGPRNR